jgi:hypothetical protein
MRLYSRTVYSDIGKRLLPYLGILMTALVTIGLALLLGTVVLMP